ncbi:hypothetical protein ACHAXR_006760 [Thalassiosira sp. AJA248-18]
MSKTSKACTGAPSSSSAGDAMEQQQQQQQQGEHTPLLVELPSSPRSPSPLTAIANANADVNENDHNKKYALPWIFKSLANRWIPGAIETTTSSRQQQSISRTRRSISRRIYLFLTEPESSISSFLFFILLILSITLSNILMMLQTMPQFQFHPPDCVICGGSNKYYSNNDDTTYLGPSLPDMVDLDNLGIDCECPPIPLPWTVWAEDVTIWFFTVEWILRVGCYEKPYQPLLSEPLMTQKMGQRNEYRSSFNHNNHNSRDSYSRIINKKRMVMKLMKQKMSYIMEWTTILDALAIFPYYIERYEKTNGLLSLRLLRLFRVFQLLRLGQYNTTFVSLTNVLVDSLLSFNILLIVLLFGASFFGSMIYWMEKGEWQYTTTTDPPSFAYMRPAADGTEEPSPFTSIPACFWWFLVTATTVGYGDTYPTTLGGKCVAVMAMLTGVLVIAFPVSVFSDLWSKELKRQGVVTILHAEQQISSSSSSDCSDSGDVKDSSMRDDAASGDCGDRELKSYYQSSRSSFENNANVVIMNEADLNAIRLHLRRIDESQDEIRRILSNYE